MIFLYSFGDTFLFIQPHSQADDPPPRTEKKPPGIGVSWCFGTGEKRSAKGTQKTGAYVAYRCCWLWLLYIGIL